MRRWRLGIALLLVCWLPLQPALAWLPVTLTSPASQMPSGMIPTMEHESMAMEGGCHEMMMSMAAPADAGAACQSQWSLLGLDGANKHCSACYQLPPGLPELTMVDFGPRPATDSPEFIATLYCNFIPGIPSPPPCSFLS